MSLRFPNKIVAVLLVVVVLLQLKDPDPLGWIAMYAAGVAACLQHGRVRFDFLVPALVGCVAAIWAALIAPDAAGVRLIELWMPMSTAGGAVEVARETIGLGLLTAWMTLLVFVSRARDSHKSS